MGAGVATFLATSDERGTPAVTRVSGVVPPGGALDSAAVTSHRTACARKHVGTHLRAQAAREMGLDVGGGMGGWAGQPH